jgi:polysaccharide biosynthesis protein PslG
MKLKHNNFYKKELIFVAILIFFLFLIIFFNIKINFSHAQSHSKQTLIPVLRSNLISKNKHIKQNSFIINTKNIPPRQNNDYTGQFGIAAGGGLTNLNDDQLNTYFQELKELGVGWIRFDIDWSIIQSDSPNSFNWSATDKVAKTAASYGIKTLGLITYTPKWARQIQCLDTEKCAPSNPTAFGTFSGIVASRYKSYGIHDWEIWNEPNYSHFWQPYTDPYRYAQILKASYQKIKKADPESIVLTGGLAATGDEDGDIAPITFVNDLYDSDTSSYFDGIAIHPYSYPALASYPAEWNKWQEIDLIHQSMILHNDDTKKIWITEFGAPTNGPGIAHNTLELNNFIYGSDYVTENAQLLILEDSLNQIAQKSYLGPFFWYTLKDNSTDTNTPENFFGLLRFDGSKKPAYYKL